MNDPTTLLVAASLYANLFAWVLVCSRKDATMLRLATTIPLAFLAQSIHDSFNGIASPLQQRVAGPMLWHNFFSLVELVLFSRADIEDLSQLSNSPSLLNAWWQALALVLNPRRIGTKWQVKGISARSETRFGFALRSAVKALASSAIMDAILRLPPKPEPHLLAPGKETLYALRNLSAEDVVFRFMIALTFTLPAIVMAALVWLTAVRVYGPRFVEVARFDDPVMEEANPRNSQTWHQCMRKVLVAFGDFTSDRILHIPRPTAASTLFRVMSPFLVSGSLHWIMELKDGGHTQGRYGVLNFFLLQPLGIVLEQVVQLIFAERLPKTVRRVVGYIWVACWFWWSMAPFSYEQTRASPPPDLAPVPFAYFIQRLLKQEG